MALLQVLACDRLPTHEWVMEEAGISIFVTVQKIYYPFLCIMGIPGVYLVWLAVWASIGFTSISNNDAEIATQPQKLTTLDLHSPLFSKHSGQQLSITN